MSSSMDEFECPKCGRMATREQDNKTCEVHVSCKCGWSGEEVNYSVPAEYNKITTGVVIQTYEIVNGKYVCVSQEFVAGDQVDREGNDGEPVDYDDWDEPEEDYPMNMIQPE